MAGLQQPFCGATTLLNVSVNVLHMQLIRTAKVNRINNLRRSQRLSLISRDTALSQSHVGRANSVAAHSLYRLTHERPAATSPIVAPTKRWCSDLGKVSANVTGNSALTDRLHPSGHLACECTEAAHKWSRLTHQSPCRPMLGLI